MGIGTNCFIVLEIAVDALGLLVVLVNATVVLEVVAFRVVVIRDRFFGRRVILVVTHSPVGLVDHHDKVTGGDANEANGEGTAGDKLIIFFESILFSSSHFSFFAVSTFQVTLMGVI